MSEHEDLQRWLASNEAALWPEAGSDAHLAPDRLAQVAEGAPLSAAERGHLVGCAECRVVLRAVVEACGAPAPEPAPDRPRWFGWRPWLGALLAAGVVAAVGFSLRSTPPEPYRARGVQAVATPEVALRATTAAGVSRDLKAGDVVARDERLGFSYANPAGAKTLTVLGWDGQRVYWYYPESAGGSPPTLAKGPGTHRLPFDVTLDDHRPGPLHVVAVFDADPQALAAALRGGSRPANTLTLEVR